MGSGRKEVNIWDLAVAESKKKLIESRDNIIPTERSSERTLLVLGGEQAGKSQLIARFMDRDEASIKPTTALDYSYVRKARSNAASNIKDVGHIYEVGGGLPMSQLMDVVITSNTIKELSLLLVLDLSKPNELWDTQEKLLAGIRTRTDSVIGEIGQTEPRVASGLRRKALDVVQELSKDKQLVNPLPVGLTIVGSKFDLFQHFDPEKKKMVCRTLRFIANSMGASLYFISVKGEALTSRLRAIMSILVFESSTLNKSVCLDHNRLLSVPFGEDSFEQIGLPSVSPDVLRSATGPPMEMWKLAYASMFTPQKASSKKANIDPVLDPQFAEETIDSMRNQKNEELERFRKLRERKTRELELVKGR